MDLFDKHASETPAWKPSTVQAATGDPWPLSTARTTEGDPWPIFTAGVLQIYYATN